ncbi:hypothetical protein D3C78_1850830 [compost metagenome]
MLLGQLAQFLLQFAQGPVAVAVDGMLARIDVGDAEDVRLEVSDLHGGQTATAALICGQGA